MKKNSILGLMISLFAVFALSSCTKDEPKKNEPKQEELSFVGKTYKVLTTWRAESIIEDESKLKDDETRVYFTFIFDSKDQLTYKQGTYTPADKTDKSGELNGNTETKYSYTYDKATRLITLTKVLSVTTDIEKQGIDPLEEQKQNAESFKKGVKLQFDEKFEVLTILATKKGETRTLPLKLQK